MLLRATWPLSRPTLSIAALYRSSAPDQTTHPKFRFLAGTAEGGVNPEQATVRKASVPCEASSCWGRSFHTPSIATATDLMGRTRQVYSYPGLSKRLNQLPIDRARKQAEQEIVTSGKMENKHGRTTNPDFTTLTADVVSAYVAHNAVRAADLPDLISSVHGALQGLERTPARLSPRSGSPRSRSGSRSPPTS